MSLMKSRFTRQCLNHSPDPTVDELCDGTCVPSMVLQSLERVNRGKKNKLEICRSAEIVQGSLNQGPAQFTTSTVYTPPGININVTACSISATAHLLYFGLFGECDYLFDSCNIRFIKPG